MKTKTIAIIGGGNLGQSVARGFLESGISPEKIRISRRRVKLLDTFKREGVITTESNVEAVTGADVVILAVKPKQTPEVCAEICSALGKETLFVSLVTAIAIEEFENKYNVKCPILRVMPNTAVELQQSMTCIAAADSVSEEGKELVVNLFKSLGQVIVINEELMAAATVLGACGIAFALRFIRAAQQGGIEIGFGADNALLIAAQTIKGAAELVLQSGNHPEREIDKVTTPQGVTISGLNVMEHQGFSSALIQGLLASYNKIK